MFLDLPRRFDGWRNAKTEGHLQVAGQERILVGHGCRESGCKASRKLESSTLGTVEVRFGLSYRILSHLICP